MFEICCLTICFVAFCLLCFSPSSRLHQNVTMRQMIWRRPADVFSSSLMMFLCPTAGQLISTWNSKQPVFLWLFQLDESEPLHKKWLFQQTSNKKLLFRVPGRATFFWNSCRSWLQRLCLKTQSASRLTLQWVQVPVLVSFALACEWLVPLMVVGGRWLVLMVWGYWDFFSWWSDLWASLYYGYYMLLWCIWIKDWPSLRNNTFGYL